MSSFGKSQTKAEFKKFRSVVSKRISGVYHTEDTRDEVKKIVSELEDTDTAFTLVKRLGQFTVFNKREFLPQIVQWKKMGAKLLDGNTFERVIDGKTFYLFVIQPATDEETEYAGMCPLAIAYGIMVSGYSYITPHKSTVELIERILRP